MLPFTSGLFVYIVVASVHQSTQQLHSYKNILQFNDYFFCKLSLKYQLKVIEI